MTARTNPFEEIERLFDQMSRQFEEASRSWESGEALGRWSSRSESMAMDLADRDDEFVVTVDLPGFDRDDVDIQITNHTLRIEAERDQSTDEKGEQYIKRERRHRSASRSIRLPEEVDTENVEATMKNGVLEITLPKTAVDEARSVEINVG